MGGSLANGACPCASSRIVIPNDQISARLLYLWRYKAALCCEDTTFWVKLVFFMQVELLLISMQARFCCQTVQSH